ncbi:MAG: prepilin-type N-terminal cleavage/methylation domain-containing protein [Gammaproteobacteria bacterium]|nr:prepilin-type N-terminal cleavage/methylation domain-containing protein [Gammaproteobacteria bacterium]
MRPFKKQHGFTLIEFIIVITIISIVSAIASKPLLQGYQAYVTAKNLINADWQVRYALQRMTVGLRSLSYITSANANSITYLDIHNHSITYDLSGNNLQRTDTSGLNAPQVLAHGIANLTFSYYDVNGSSLATPVATPTSIQYIVITLNVSYKNIVFTAMTSVAPRNTP